jgi:hypothetical protein
MIPIQRRPFLNSLSLFLSTLAVVMALHALAPVLIDRAIAHPSVGTDPRDRPTALANVALTPDGLGPIRINASPQEAETAIGTPLDPWEPTSRATCHFHGIPGLEGVGIMVSAGAIARIDIWEPAAAITTPARISIGSTLGDLERAYPGQVRLEPHPHLPNWRNAIVTPRADAAIGSSLNHWLFTLDESNQIRQFRAGRTPELTWANGCA